MINDRFERIDRAQAIIPHHSTRILNHIDTMIGQSWKENVEGLQLIFNTMTAIINNDVKWAIRLSYDSMQASLITLVANVYPPSLSFELLTLWINI